MPRMTLYGCTLAESPATLSIKSSDGFVASTAASIASGWSESVSGREFHLLKVQRPSRRTFSPTINPFFGSMSVASHRVFY